jgi:hypothetical protein
VVGAPAGSSVPNVGRGDGVKLGRDVGLGKGVLVGTGVGGIAALVIATKVFTMAIAEACIWAESVVGTAFAPQALSRKAVMAVTNIRRFTVLSPFSCLGVFSRLSKQDYLVNLPSISQCAGFLGIPAPFTFSLT